MFVCTGSDLTPNPEEAKPETKLVLSLKEVQRPFAIKETTSFPGSLLFTSQAGSVKRRDPGNEVVKETESCNSIGFVGSNLLKVV